MINMKEALIILLLIGFLGCWFLYYFIKYFLDDDENEDEEEDEDGDEDGDGENFLIYGLHRRYESLLWSHENVPYDS
jgi:hypothetical protein